MIIINKKRMKHINKVNRDFFTYEINHKYFLIDETTEIKKRINFKQYDKLNNST